MPNEWLQSKSRPASNTRRRVGLAVIALCLFAPSLWMLVKIPPLWKDIDAYFQVAFPPSVGPILHYGPGYSFPARLPLYAGYAFDCFRAGLPLPSWRFIAEPTLSDSGVLLLLVVQHAALCFASCFLIFSAARLFIARLILALLWAKNPLFYSITHTVGSEALSLILTLLLATLGLQMIKCRGKIPYTAWFLFAFLLWFAVLTREINSILAALLPLAFGLSGLVRLLMTNREQSAKDLRRMLAAIALGLACLSLTSASMRGFSKLAGLQYRSRLGLSFASRLNFLAALPPPERDQVLGEIAAGTTDPNLHTILSLLREELPAGVHFESGNFIEKSQALLPPEIGDSEARFDQLLNELTRAFLVPPRRAFLRFVAADFAKYQLIRVDHLVRDRFVSTVFFFGHEKDMPGCATLVTYRETSETEIMHYLKGHRYLRPPKDLTHLSLLCFWLGSFALAAFLRPCRFAEVASYTTSLILVGLILFLAHSLLSSLLIRYALPTFELTIASITILLGSVVQFIQLGSGEGKARWAAGEPG